MWEWLSQKRLAFADFLSRLSGSLWLRPSCWLLFFIALALSLTLLEATYIDPAAWNDAHFMLRSQPDGARTMLGAIAGSILTVVSLAFSLMMVVVIQAANAYTPRLLRQYISDKQNHHVLGILMGSFAYCILVLRAVRDEPAFVPHIALNVSIVLSILCIIALISFIQHVSRSIEVGNIITLIEQKTYESLDKPHYHDVGHAHCGGVERPEVGVDIRAQRSGYVRVLDTRELERMILRERFMMELHYGVGEHVISGAILATVWRGEVDAQMREDLQDVFVLGKERAWSQDTRYGFQQLADIGLRALSPGVNDPTTGIMALNAISNLLARVIERGPSSRVRACEQGAARLIFPPDGLRRILIESVWPFFDYGREDCQLVTRLVEVVGELGDVIHRDDQRALLADMLLSVHERVEVERFSRDQQRHLDACFERARRRLRVSHELGSLTRAFTSRAQGS